MQSIHDAVQIIIGKCLIPVETIGRNFVYFWLSRLHWYPIHPMSSEPSFMKNPVFWRCNLRWLRKKIQKNTVKKTTMSHFFENASICESLTRAKSCQFFTESPNKSKKRRRTSSEYKYDFMPEPIARFYARERIRVKSMLIFYCVYCYISQYFLTKYYFTSK